MSSSNSPHPLDGVNRSGYPLQIALAHEVESRKGAHGWRVLYREHAWRNRVDQMEGYLDLVLEHDAMQIVLVLECKRVKDGDWTFLPEDGDAQRRRAAQGFRVEQRGEYQASAGWMNHPFDPRSPQTAFCVMPKDARDPTVDSIAAELVSATEALAEEETNAYLRNRGGSFRRIYFPAIVTTARLWVCSFDPDDIALDAGTIPLGSLRESYALVRYTKQLSTRPIENLTGVPFGAEAQALSSAKSRTALVIVADRLDNFLCDFAVDDRPR